MRVIPASRSQESPESRGESARMRGTESLVTRVLLGISLCVTPDMVSKDAATQRLCRRKTRLCEKNPAQPSDFERFLPEIEKICSFSKKPLADPSTKP